MQESTTLVRDVEQVGVVTDQQAAWKEHSSFSNGTDTGGSSMLALDAAPFPCRRGEYQHCSTVLPHPSTSQMLLSAR